MKIINEKGMLFGMVNIIDFIVILFLLGSVPVLYLGYVLTTSKVGKKAREVSIQVTFNGVIPELAKAMKVGDSEHDVLGNTIGHLNHISEIKDVEITVLVGAALVADKVIAAYRSNRKDVRATLKVLCNEKAGDFYYKEQLIKIGKEFTFSAERYVAVGQIVEMESDS